MSGCPAHSAGPVSTASPLLAVTMPPCGLMIDQRYSGCPLR
ncbi:hypothetical protein BURPSS13_C0186 [Burkholderia pseudomallei S13]|nr:hypothetical protein BURPSS13_C0186 [Burkholderia pseudomallei S13]